MQCLPISVQWVVEILSCTATLPRGSGQWNSYNALPCCLGAVGSGTPAMHGLTDCGQWATELLQCTATLLGGNGQCNSCNALPYRLGAVGRATPPLGSFSASDGGATVVLAKLGNFTCTGGHC